MIRKRAFHALATLAFGVAASTLAGCGALDKIDEMQLAADRDTCGKYGFVQGTDPFAACMQRTSMERQRRFDAQTKANMNVGDKKPDAPKMDCKTTEVVNASADGTSTQTQSRTTCVGM